VAVRETDRESFESWARVSQQRLLRAAYLLTGDLYLAEDLLQEALVKAALRWDTLGGQQPEAWVRRVMYRDHVSWWRRHRRERRVAEVPDERGSAGPGEAAAMLRDALGVLTPRQRAVVLLRYVDDLTATQTADVLGVTVGTVKKLGSVALARLRADAPGLADLAEDRS
jgi:RNA polymerase sigma-70 factor (sigma-E family)